MVFVMAKCSFVLISVCIFDSTEDKVAVEDPSLSGIFSIAYSHSLPPPCLELSLVNFVSEDLASVEMFEAKAKLADILRGIR